MSSEPADFPFTFSCRRSGHCCTRPEGRVRLGEGEIADVARAVGLGEAGFRSRFLDPGPDGDWILRLAPDGACPFFARAGSQAACTVYDVRPTHCRTFPYWDELREPGPLLDEAMRFCPGIRPLA